MGGRGNGGERGAVTSDFESESVNDFEELCKALLHLKGGKVGCRNDDDDGELINLRVVRGNGVCTC
jgi:hypothetical protein